MIKQLFRIDKYDWKVIVLYEISYRDTDYVIDMLKQMDAPDYILRSAYKNVNEGQPNTGFIYSDYDKQRSIIVVSKTTSNRELIDTIVHEANHLQSHIATVFNLDEKGEEVCYLIGDIVKRMYKVFNKIISAQ